jgi:ADP-ribose pyrophosphatase YjhB (NUDIX family)
MKYRLNVVCLIERDGKILLGKKAEGVGPYPGTWLIPGGGVNAETESIDEAMKREVKEETNLDVTKSERMLFGEDVADRHGEMTQLIYLYYKIIDVLDWKNEKAGDDLVKLQWFSFDELKTLPLPPVSKKLYKQLGWIQK